jgi:hypothetical protein
VLRIKAEKEAAERAAFESARAAREAAEEGGIAAVIAAKKAAAEKMEASNEVASTKVAEGVRFAWDFEIDDVHTVYRTHPCFVNLDIRRSEVLRWLRELQESGHNVADFAAVANIRAFKKPIVSSR